MDIEEDVNELGRQIKALSTSEIVDLLNAQRQKVAKSKAAFQTARIAFKIDADRLAFIQHLFRSDKILRDCAMEGVAMPVDYSHDTVISGAQKILAEIDSPLHVEDIILYLKAGSFLFRAKDPARSVEVALQGATTIFEKVHAHVFKLREDHDAQPSGRSVDRQRARPGT